MQHTTPAESSRVIDEVHAKVRQWVSEAAALPAGREAELLAGILADPKGLEFTVGFVDRVVRPEDSSAASTHLRHLAEDPPAFLPTGVAPVLKAGALATHATPRPVISSAQAVMRTMVRHLILDARERKLTAALKRYRAEGARLNINQLGEAVHGAREADRRLEAIAALVARPDVDYCSIKVSAIVDHIALWAASDTRARIVERLVPIYRLAAQQPTATFINLDMEEFHDLELTLDVFEELMTRKEFKNLYAGIVLQAYVPDAERAYERVAEIAKRRVDAGGAPVKVRLVKGANLPLERVDASVHGWPLATFSTKAETDAHYKRMLRRALEPSALKYVHMGVAGHNLFDIAYAAHLMRERGIPVAQESDNHPLVEFEMLAGMAPAQQQVISRELGPIRLYVPIVHPREFDVAVSYLVRRLEENASTENFMSAVMQLEESEALFEREASRFATSLEMSLNSEAPRTHRTADRYHEGHNITLGSEAVPATAGHFKNTPDTDVSTRANQRWAEEIRARVAQSSLGVQEAENARVSSIEGVEHAIDRAVQAHTRWAHTPVSERASVLREVALTLAAHRAELLEVAASETGKMLEQGDPEVSEAVDFALYYADSIEELHARTDVTFTPRTLTLVTPPWNFPIAIPCGSITAALATGSSVIVKPAPQARRTGAYLVSLMHRAGVDPHVLQIVDVEENEVGRRLIEDPTIDQIILTGAYDTAKLFGSFNPTARIKAETSGKNAIIVTEHADLDLAVKDIATSAFGHAGQKCSAASLVITVGSVTRSPRFHRQLADAVRSLTVGYPVNPGAEMGPVIEKPGDKLRRGLTHLGSGERWLAKPQPLDDSGRLYSPGVREGVKEGSEFHLTEYFGPVTGLMHADTLEDALRLQNGTDYGLTAGLHSLEPSEIRTWLRDVQAGNLYVNRGITGAIVQRQPFGGWKRSAVGQTAKAGGPNYLVHLMDAHEPPRLDHQTDAQWLEDAQASDRTEWAGFFAPTDRQRLEGEINVLRYRPCAVIIRGSAQVSEIELARVLHAAATAGAHVEVSLPDGELHDLTAKAARGITVVREDASTFAARVVHSGADRVRAIGGLEPELAEAIAQEPEIGLFTGPVLSSGRVEILPFVREQSVSAANHRYGNPLPYDLEKIITEA